MIGLQFLERVGQRFLGVFGRVGPHLGGQKHLVTLLPQGDSDRLFGFAVHVGRVDEVDAQSRATSCTNCTTPSTLTSLERPHGHVPRARVETFSFGLAQHARGNSVSGIDASARG